jgi:outer membrane protein assembly factor BamE (lipoprotein component of BamABCDE complex)
MQMRHINKESLSTLAAVTAPRTKARLSLALLLAAALPLAACDYAVIKHGTQFHEGDLQQITPGMSEQQVRMNLGTPATTAVLGTGQAYYYISSTQTQTAFFLPKEEERQVVAVYFTQGGTVDRVANYGLQDGKVIDTVSRTTPAPGGKDEGIIKQLFRNLGQKQLFGN